MAIKRTRADVLKVQRHKKMLLSNTWPPRNEALIYAEERMYIESYVRKRGGYDA